jgi:hypothetical protein
MIQVGPQPPTLSDVMKALDTVNKNLAQMKMWQEEWFTMIAGHVDGYGKLTQDNFFVIDEKLHVRFVTGQGQGGAMDAGR